MRSRPLRTATASASAAATLAFAAATAAAATAAAGCDGSSPYPWESSGAPPGGIPAPVAVEASASGPPAPAAVPAGGLFQKCLAGLEAERDPVVDVVRIVTACGPSTGMRRMNEAILEGAVGGSTPSITFDLALKDKRCYRIFAVADAGIGELDVEVRTSRGTVVASDHRTGRVAVAQPDGPFCAHADDAATIEVRAASGSGTFALDILFVPAALGIDGPRHDQ